jgi:hypothetical protein
MMNQTNQIERRWHPAKFSHQTRKLQRNIYLSPCHHQKRRGRWRALSSGMSDMQKLTATNRLMSGFGLLTHWSLSSKSIFSRPEEINCQTIPYDLLERGYTNQLCVDFSTVVVEAMKSRHADKPQVEWQVGDVRDMKALGTKSVDVAFDKGTLDAMIHGSPWSPPDEVLENSGKYINEVSLGVRHMWCLKLMMTRS